MNSNSKIAIIGAGPSGITALKNLTTNGFNVTCFEMNDQIGGNWVYKDKTGHSTAQSFTMVRCRFQNICKYTFCEMPDASR